MIGGAPEIHKADKLTFIIIGDKIICRTSLGQQFYLLPKAHYWLRRVRLIKVMIQLNEVRSLEELAGWTNPGISWEPTSQHYEPETGTVMVK